MKNRLAILLGLLVIGIAAGLYYHHLQLAKVAIDGNRLVLYGNVDIREVHVAFNGSEHVSQMLVDEGDHVKAGQLLARLQTARLQAALDQARADVVAAKAQAHSAQLNYRRIRQLAQRRLASKADADVAEANSRAAVAQVAAAQAVVESRELALNDASLYAPVAGVIRERLVEPGDFVTPQTPVYTLAMTKPVWIRAYAPENVLGKIKLGAPAQITTDSYPDKVYTGWVGAISPTAEFTPKNVETPDLRTQLVYQVRVIACNPQDELRLGMPATVSISLKYNTSNTSSQARCQPHKTQ